MNTSKAKSLITGENQPINEGPEGTPPGGGTGGPGPGGPPRRPAGPPMRRERPSGPFGSGQEESGLSPKERMALKDLIILDMLQALGNDAFYAQVAEVALKGAPMTPQFVRHIMDEAPKYADRMTPEVNALMEKIAAMPTR